MQLYLSEQDLEKETKVGICKSAWNVSIVPKKFQKNATDFFFKILHQLSFCSHNIPIIGMSHRTDSIVSPIFNNSKEVTHQGTENQGCGQTCRAVCVLGLWEGDFQAQAWAVQALKDCIQLGQSRQDFPHTTPIAARARKSMGKSSEAGMKPLCVCSGLHRQGLASCTLQRKCSESLVWA